VSAKRLKTYVDAADCNILNGIKLYQKNINLSSNCLRYISIFEVAFRNEVDRFYKQKFNSQDWIGLFPKEMIRNNSSIGIEKMTLGFWVHLFAPKQFRHGGQCLHRIYIYRPNGVSPRELFNDLLFILNFRNRIAHHLVWLGYDIPTLIYFKRLNLKLE
jgi:hypothetical protein